LPSLHQRKVGLAILVVQQQKTMGGSLNRLPHIDPNARLLLQSLLPQNITTDVTSKTGGQQRNTTPTQALKEARRPLLLQPNKIPELNMLLMYAHADAQRDTAEKGEEALSFCRPAKVQEAKPAMSKE